MFPFFRHIMQPTRSRYKHTNWWNSKTDNSTYKREPHECPSFRSKRQALQIKQSSHKHSSSYSVRIRTNNKHRKRSPIYFRVFPCKKKILYRSVCRSFIQSVSLLDSNLTLRLLMSYIYGAPILDVSRSHTTTQHSR